MAMSGGGRRTQIRSQFSVREGIYRQMPNLEYSRQNRVPFSLQGPTPITNPVTASFVDIEHEGTTISRIVFTVGRDIFYYNCQGVMQPVDLSDPLDKRVYKGVLPTCHDINKHTAHIESVHVAVGFAAGQVQIIDVATKQSLQILNEERMVEKASTSCVRWVPNSDSLLISSHANGHMYTFDVSQKNMNVIPQYHDKPHKTSGDISIYTLKSKHYATPTGIPLGILKNLVYKWVVTHENSPINDFRFSPDGNTIAIASQDGYLRVVDYRSFEMKGAMKSYFGGLLCCCWSPDGRYIVTGGEDDLVTVWSFYGSFVLARGHGHRSWVSGVAFDKFSCFVPEEEEIMNWYGGDSPALTRNDVKSLSNSSEHEKSHGFKGGDANDLPYSSNKKELKSPVSQLQNYVRRHRTDSTVSRMSKISIAGSVDAPPRVCYRFGSVGQDAQLCLWEMTDDVLFPRRRTVSMLRTCGSVHSKGREVLCSHFIKPKHDQSSLTTMVNGYRDERDSFHSDSVMVNTTDSHSPTETRKGKHAKSNGTPPGVKESSLGISRGFTLFSSSKDSSKSSHNQGGTPGKFATIGSAGQQPKKENAKEHKRNLSMPYFGSKNSHKNQVNTNNASKSDQRKESQPTKTLGTVLCPRLDETAMLEPLICKRITQGRLTCLCFRRDSIVTACQDGYIQTWSRPQQSESPRSIPASPPKDLSSLNSPAPSPKLSPSKNPSTQV